MHWAGSTGSGELGHILEWKILELDLHCALKAGVLSEPSHFENGLLDQPVLSCVVPTLLEWGEPTSRARAGGGLCEPL